MIAPIPSLRGGSQQTPLSPPSPLRGREKHVRAPITCIAKTARNSIAGLSHRLACIFFSLTLLTVMLMSHPAAAEPLRIASLNLCTDQLLLAMTPRENIAGVTFMAADQHLSYYAREAEGLPVLDADAESILSAKPDIVITVTGTRPQTSAMLRSLGIPVLEFALPQHLAEIPAYIRAIASAIGEPEKGTQLVARMKKQLKEAQANAHARGRPLVAAIEANHIAHGGGTMLGELIRLTGGDNLASRLGKSGLATLSLEEIVYHQPDILIYGTYDASRLAQGETYLFHESLEPYHDSGRAIRLPSHLTSCPDHTAGEAALALAKALDYALGTRRFALAQ
ncbi:MAG: ABC transporter substrate-binding protein [Alphaproteobacteria bacterium]|nr:ABC transporter substrate-binding protein [Alphaproteobacteria bacterium]